MSKQVSIAFEMTLKDKATEEELVDMLIYIVGFYGSSKDVDRLKRDSSTIVRDLGSDNETGIKP